MTSEWHLHPPALTRVNTCLNVASNSPMCWAERFSALLNSKAWTEIPRLLYNTNTPLYKNIPLTLYSRKGWCWLYVRGELETGTDGYILTQSSSDHSSTSFASWLGCSTVGHWGPKTLRLPLVLTPASCPQLTPIATGTGTDLNWLKPYVAPGYIFVWHPPASCGRMHLHRIQPRPQLNIFDRMHQFRSSSANLHRCISWLTARSRVNMLHLHWYSQRILQPQPTGLAKSGERRIKKKIRKKGILFSTSYFQLDNNVQESCNIIAKKKKSGGNVLSQLCNKSRTN